MPVVPPGQAPRDGGRQRPPRPGCLIPCHPVSPPGRTEPCSYDQQVLVNPADLGSGQAGQEGSRGRAQLLRRVEGERRAVAPLGLGLEPLGRARPRMLEGLCGHHREPAGSPDRVPECGLAVQALLVLGETREVAAPDRPPDLPPHRRLQAREPQRGPDRALPPGPSLKRSASLPGNRPQATSLAAAGATVIAGRTRTPCESVKPGSRAPLGLQLTLFTGKAGPGTSEQPCTFAGPLHSTEAG